MITPEIIPTIIVAMFASTGFWTLVNNVYQDKKKPKDTPEKEHFLDFYMKT